MGRFISRDPILGRDGDALSRNGYIYVKNNPLKFVDPSGETTKEAQAQHEEEQSWWEKFVVGVGNIAENLASRYPIVDAALNNPLITGPAIGVAVGAGIVGVVYTLGGSIVCGALCPAVVAGGTAATTAAGKAWQFSQEILDKALNKVLANLDKFDHIFKNAGHDLEPVVTKMGGQENVIRAAINGLSNVATNGAGVWEKVVNVGGFNVTVRGVIVDGIPRIGTLFIPK